MIKFFGKLYITVKFIRKVILMEQIFFNNMLLCNNHLKAHEYKQRYL